MTRSPSEVKSPIARAHELGQSFWLDYIRRDILETGELQAAVEAGEIRGVTSNPSIFKAAIAGSDLYNADIRPMAYAGWSPSQIYERLAIDDIRQASDQLLPLYEGTSGGDGYVSIEVNPHLAHDTAGTLDEVRRLWQAVDRPNFMVKIPATAEGIPAIEQAIADGINVNVTLVFSLDRYTQVMEAYLGGLERRREEGQTLSPIASVASFFVSRVDTAVDQQLEAIVREEGPQAERAAALLGSAAIANAKMAYAQFKAVFEGEQFTRLEAEGARVQRPLWASTSTKNPAYSDVRYVEQLIGPDTVNTVPPETLDAFRDHGVSEPTLERELAQSVAQLAALESIGVSLQAVTAELEAAGVEAFAQAYDSLLDAIEQRAGHMRRGLSHRSNELMESLAWLGAERFASRFWASAPATEGGGAILIGHLDRRLIDFREWARELEQGPVAFYGPPELARPLEGLVDPGRLVVLETVEPDEFEALKSDSMRAHVVVSQAAFDPVAVHVLEALYEDVERREGAGAARKFLVAAPDRSPVARVAGERGIQSVGASSSLSVHAALAELLGLNAGALLEGAQAMESQTAPGPPAELNPGLQLGALLALGDMKTIGLDGDPSLTEFLAAMMSERSVGQHRSIVTGDWPAHLRIALADGAEELEGEVVATLDARDGLQGIGAESVRWEMAAAAAAALTDGPLYPETLRAASARHLAEWLAKSPRHSLPRTSLELEGNQLWWSGREFALDSARAADAVAGRLRGADRIDLAVYRRRTAALDAAIAALASRIRSVGPGLLRVSYGTSPPGVLEGPDVVHLSIGEPAALEDVDGLTATELMLLAQLAEWDVLRKRKRRALAVRTPDAADLIEEVTGAF